MVMTSSFIFRLLYFAFHLCVLLSYPLSIICFTIRSRSSWVYLLLLLGIFASFCMRIRDSFILNKSQLNPDSNIRFLKTMVIEIYGQSISMKLLIPAITCPGVTFILTWDFLSRPVSVPKASFNPSHDFYLYQRISNNVFAPPVYPTLKFLPDS